MNIPATCAKGEHLKVVQDRFSQLPGVKRRIPGNCYCLDCKQPVAAWWNGGKPKPANE